jgi:prepilin-type N-terminal cleavage/methylation domain-containing protein
MKYLKKKTKGFTLVELMIVVAIIGILAAVAIPKFANLIVKAKEGATKGSLGAIRSAISIYYGDNEGIYPQNLTDTTYFVRATKYIDELPLTKLGDHADSTGAIVAVSVTDAAGWWYEGSGNGKVHVNCSHTDRSVTPKKVSTW